MGYNRQQKKMKKKIFMILGCFALFMLWSCYLPTYSSSGNRSYDSDAYSTPTSPNSGTCTACGGRGYIMRNGQKETCVCGGTGKATSFPSK